MARNCSIYVNNGGKCSTESSTTSNSTTSTTSQTTTPIITDLNERSKLVTNGKGMSRIKPNCDSKEWCESLQTTIKVPMRIDESNNITQQPLICNKNIANEIMAIFDDIIKNTDYIIKGYNCFRSGSSLVKANGQEVLSYHAYGTAIDLGTNSIEYPNGVTTYINPYVEAAVAGQYAHVNDNTFIRTDEHPVVQIFLKHKWYWGGYWSKKDYMHFSYFNG